jgi:hypothetical protein
MIDFDFLVQDKEVECYDPFGFCGFCEFYILGMCQKNKQEDCENENGKNT